MANEKPPVSEYPKSTWLTKPKNPGGRRFKWLTVTPGATLSNIARRPDIRMSWATLTDFNWGTKDPAEINWYLKTHCGCMDVPDGKNYAFSGGERIWVPDGSSSPAPVGFAAASTSSSGSTASTAAISYLDGDILLRAGEEDWIKTITNGAYSHAGICVSGATEEGVDALPEEGPRRGPDDPYDPADPSLGGTRRPGYDVARFPISGFYEVANAPGGGDVFRYTGPRRDAEAAARWAEGEVGKPYTFNLWDPIIGASGGVDDNNQLYCSEFVWRSYRTGAGVTLVDPKDFMNLKDPKVYDRNIKILTEVAQRDGQIPGWVPDVYARKKVREHFKDHNGYFMAPRQLADSTLVRKVKSIRGGAKMPPTSSDGGKK